MGDVGGDIGEVVEMTEKVGSTIKLVVLCCVVCVFFFFNDTATTEIYTLSLHDALPISDGGKTWSVVLLSDCVSAIFIAEYCRVFIVKRD